jgi:xanthine dehydrogenase FAD-binding subunit
MSLWQEYRRPKKLSEALHDLTSAPGPVLPIAGGTDLLIELQQGHHESTHTLVDLNSVDEMTALELRGDELFIGAAVPVNHIVASALVLRHAQALVEAADLIGGPQVRNTATLGGNVAHALPAADGTIALVALDAQVEIGSVSGLRRIPLQGLFSGPGKSILKSGGELLVGFYIKQIKKGEASAFKRIMRPQGVALPIINLAVWLEREKDTITDIRIAVGPAGPTPFRATGAEAVLRGQKFDEAARERGLEALLAQAQFRTSPQRASADYRRHLVSVLLKDTLETAWERANYAAESQP